MTVTLHPPLTSFILKLPGFNLKSTAYSMPFSCISRISGSFAATKCNVPSASHIGLSPIQMLITLAVA